MGIRYHFLDLDGQSVGIAVSLGSRSCFYSPDPRLADLDGEIFADLATVVRQVQERLGAAGKRLSIRGRRPEPPIARPRPAGIAAVA